jgi:hypothetical protein
MAISIVSTQTAERPTPRRTRAISVILAGATLFGFVTTATAQVELKTYADAKGYINVRTLTCAQLAGTFQEDADFLGVWYSGWYNGRNKKHVINIVRTKDGIHEVIVYCKANPDKKVTEAIESVLKGK